MNILPPIMVHPMTYHICYKMLKRNLYFSEGMKKNQFTIKYCFLTYKQLLLRGYVEGDFSKIEEYKSKQSICVLKPLNPFQIKERQK